MFQRIFTDLKFIFYHCFPYYASAFILSSMMPLWKKQNVRYEGCYYQYTVTLLYTGYIEASLHHFPSLFLFPCLKWKGINVPLVQHLFCKISTDCWMSDFMSYSKHTQWCVVTSGEPHPSFFKRICSHKDTCKVAGHAVVQEHLPQFIVFWCHKIPHSFPFIL